ncbi:MAG: sulfatase [Verrucomicrobiia bacterium]
MKKDVKNVYYGSRATTKFRACILIFAIFFILITLAGINKLQAGGSYNFVFILADDLGWTDLGCMGSPVYQTPNIDALARGGMRFTQAYSACTVCSPTRASILTGQYSARLHLTDWIKGHARPYAKLKIPDWTMYLSTNVVNIAKVLKSAGYTCASIGKWHLGGEEYYPEKEGFDINIGGCDKGQPPSYFSPYKIPTLTDGPKGEYLTDREAQEAVNFIKNNKDKPFFLYLAHHAVHTPLMAKSNLVEKYKAITKTNSVHKNATYAAMIESMDASVGAVMKCLRELNLEEKTIVIFTSDNGGLLNVTTNIGLRAGKGSSYEGGVRVPLIVYWKNVVKPGSICDEPVISVDYFPTILEIAGLKAPQNHIVDGESIVPLLKQTGKLRRENIFWHYPHYHPGGATPYSAVRSGNFKLIEFFEDSRLELYDLAADPSEKNNIANKNPELTRKLHELLKEWRKKVGAQLPTPNPDYAPEKDKKR